jgi:hypothetical protein
LRSPRQGQMAQVNRIEGSAENADIHRSRWRRPLRLPPLSIRMALSFLLLRCFAQVAVVSGG